MIGRLLHRRSVQRYLDEMISVCLHDSLSFDSLYKSKSAIELVRQWKINNEESLYEKVQWLLYEGYRKEFQQARQYLSAYSDRERLALGQAPLDNDKWLKRLSLAERYGERLPAEGIAAFDYAWCVVWTTVGTTLGWMDESTAFAYATQAAVGAQDAYSGWDEYLFGYAVGAEFTGRFPSADFTEQNEAGFMHLLDAWKQPINRMDWKMRLRHV